MTKRTSDTFSSRFLGCVLGGALGDALGAPLENNHDFEKMHASYGDSGLDHLIPYDPNISWGDSDQRGIGAVTDDTTMLAATLASMTRTLAAGGNPDHFNHLAWQAYLTWGELQMGGKDLAMHRDPAIVWDELKPFLFSCGAGRGTIAALLSGRIGTPEHPIDYDVEIRGKRMQGPNKGCGGMMRVAPIAFLANDADGVFNLAARNAAITHGDPDAFLASGAVAMMVHHMRNGEGGAYTVLSVMNYLKDLYPGAGAGCISALNAAIDQSYVISTRTIDRLPSDIGASNPFLALPVLAQVAYALMISDFIPGSNQDKFAKTLSVAVTHSGDSDSVGAIVGNCLGARWGKAALPKDWLQQLTLKAELEKLATGFLAQPVRTIGANHSLHLRVLEP